jgi:hypothetical protein
MTVRTLRPSATPIDWEIIKGDQFDIHIPVLDDSDVLVDVTGYTVKAQVRRSEEEPVLYEWSDAAGNAETSGTNAVLHVLAADTALWTFTKALVSVVVYAPITNVPRFIADGTIRALPRSTQ